MSKEISASALRRPVAQSAAGVAIHLLDDAVKRRDRLDDPSDDEALHDFRVALRRLRSWLRAFRPHLDDVVRKRTRRRLSRLADATNAGRDAEVQLEWLREQRHDLSTKQREGLDWLIARLESRARDADARLRRRLSKDFPRICRDLEALQDVADGNAPLADAAPLASAAAELVREHAHDVRRHLGAVRSVGDEREVHQARIAGKRLRYLLEPFTEQVAESKHLLERLEELQDATGELHDAHVLLADIADAISAAARDRARRITATMRDDDVDPEREREVQSAQPDAEPGLLALGRRVRARIGEAFADVEEHWLRGGAESLFDEALHVAGHLDALARDPTSTGEAAPERDREIERKYLLRALPPEVGSAPSSEIEQGYLPGARVAERLRRTVDTGSDGGRERLYRTVKVGNGLSRTEVEEEAPRDMFDAMWPLTQGRRVRKRRYRVHDGPHVWEIDEFLDRDLVIAEVELERADVDVEPPAWLARHVVRDVTEEPAFANQNLAR